MTLTHRFSRKLVQPVDAFLSKGHTYYAVSVVEREKSSRLERFDRYQSYLNSIDALMERLVDAARECIAVEINRLPDAIEETDIQIELVKTIF